MKILPTALLAFTILLTSCISADDVRVRMMKDGKLEIMHFDAGAYRNGDTVLFEKKVGNDIIYYPSDNMSMPLVDTIVVYEYQGADSTNRIFMTSYRVGIIEEIQ